MSKGKKIFADPVREASDYIRKDTQKSICYNEQVPARKAVYANEDALRDGQERNKKLAFTKSFLAGTDTRRQRGKMMIQDGKIWVGSTQEGTRVELLPQMANRHGLIAGATGTGKTATLKGLAESFSALGVPVFLADIKGDLSGICEPGTPDDNITKRLQKIGMEEKETVFTGYPVTFWDIYGKRGIPLRTTISEMGPLLLSRILGLNDLQSDLLSVAFQIADRQQLLLVDIKDLKALLNYMDENRAAFQEEYGKISSASLAVIIRSLAALEAAGGDLFFGEVALNIRDWFTTDEKGRGMIHILDSGTLMEDGKLYAAFLLWMLSELFEQLPEVGDMEKPRMVFFFDEAHLLFRGASQTLLDKITQVVRLIRSKGVGIYFCTQDPSDIPDEVLTQLGNRVQHALHAYTPKDQKAVRAAAQSFRENPELDTYQTILELGVGEAVCSFLGEDGVPGMVQKTIIAPPLSGMGAISEELRKKKIESSTLYPKYSQSEDPDSAYEFLKRKASEEEAAKQKAEEDKAAAAAAAREQAAKDKEEEKARKAQEKTVRNAAKSVSSSAAGTIGREVGKSIGGSLFGKFGKTLGGNVGASLGRGIVGTLFRK